VGLTLAAARRAGRSRGVDAKAVPDVGRGNGPGEQRGMDGRWGEVAGAAEERRRKSTALGEGAGAVPF
jgi:hypothetical protein